MLTENTAVTSSSYEYIEGKVCPFVGASVPPFGALPPMSDEFYLLDSKPLAHESEEPAHEGSEASASLREAPSAESDVRQPVGVRRGQAAGDDADG